MTNTDIINQLESKSEVINDHLWYVNPKDITTALNTQRDDIRNILKKERETWAKESIGDKALQSLEMALSENEPYTGEPCQEYIEKGKCRHQPSLESLQ